VLVISNGVSMDFQNSFFLKVASKIKHPLLSCRFLYIGAQHHQVCKEFGQVGEEQIIREVAARLDGSFHRLVLFEESSSNPFKSYMAQWKLQSGGDFLGDLSLLFKLKPSRIAFSATAHCQSNQPLASGLKVLASYSLSCASLS